MFNTLLHSYLCPVNLLCAIHVHLVSHNAIFSTLCGGSLKNCTLNRKKCSEVVEVSLVLIFGSNYVHAEWTKTRDLVQQNFQHHFHSRVMAAFCFSIHYYREIIQLQYLPPMRYGTRKFNDLYRTKSNCIDIVYSIVGVSQICVEPDFFFHFSVKVNAPFPGRNT